MNRIHLYISLHFTNLREGNRTKLEFFTPLPERLMGQVKSILIVEFNWRWQFPGFHSGYYAWTYTCQEFVNKYEHARGSDGVWLSWLASFTDACSLNIHCCQSGAVLCSYPWHVIRVLFTYSIQPGNNRMWTMLLGYTVYAFIFMWTPLVALEQIGQRHEGRYMHTTTGGSPNREF